MQKEQLMIAAKKRAFPMLWSIVRLLLLIGLSYTILYPLLAKLALTFMDTADLGDLTVKWVPKHFTFDNLRIVTELMDYGTAFLYTFGLCLLVTVLQVASCLLAAYGFARYRSKLKNIVFIVVIATILIPPQTYIVTLYTQFQYFDFFGIISLITGAPVNILNSEWTVILLAASGTGLRSGLFIYLLCQTFRGLPKELEEAALVDGAGPFRTFASVMLPNAIPMTVVSAILTFAWQWNDTFYSTHFLANKPLMSLINVAYKASQYLGDWSTVNSSVSRLYSSVGSLLKMLPLIILFLLCQKTFIQSAERSGIVG